MLLPTSATGAISFQTTVACSPPPGLTLYAQFWIQDPAGPAEYSASNALSQTAP